MTIAELADIFEGWATSARAEADQALSDDQIGKAARLRGRAEGLTLAAVEMRRGARTAAFVVDLREGQ